jgi:hypothetical protein
MTRRRRYGSSGAIVEDLYARRGKIQRYKLVVPPAHGYGRFVAYFATKKHAHQTAKNLKSAGYRPRVITLLPEASDTLSKYASWLRKNHQRNSLRSR